MAAALLLLPYGTFAAADESDSNSDTNHLNRVTVSARIGFNMSAKFRGFAALPQPTSSRLTPRGDRYNYDDGYVLTDVSGNFGGQTWYWGYDSSASQISGNNILLSRSTIAGGAADLEVDSGASPGAEILYRRQLGANNSLRYGVEVAGNYQNLSLSGSSSGTASVTRTTDAYPYTSGTTPPTASSSSPYQGSYEGPGFVIGDSPVSSSSTTTAGGATLSGNEHLDANLWGLRLGPYLEIPLSDRWDISLSGGLAVGFLDATVSWSETATLSSGASGTASGGGSDFRSLWGGYVAGTVTWQMSERWSLAAGVQYQILQSYEHSFGGQNVAIDLRNAFFVTFGVGYSF